VEIRRPFWYLIVHFIQDYLHFDTKFWKTLNNLLFHPGKLPIDYLNGKHKSNVNPISLYIFISFITFFVPAVLPDLSEKKPEQEIQEKVDLDGEGFNLFGKQITEIHGKDFEEIFLHNIPKLIFFYLPIFAFWLWLFHHKKRWLYFDHGIFTLYLFSFILLTYTFYDIANYICIYLNIKVVDDIFTYVMVLYSLYYFFRAHRLMYQEKRAKS
jgi:hypothetical protein